MGRDALGVGFLGYGWISRAHAHALHTLNHLAPLGKEIRLVSIAGRRRSRSRRLPEARLRALDDELGGAARRPGGPRRRKPDRGPGPRRADDRGAAPRQAGLLREAAGREPGRGVGDARGRGVGRGHERDRVQLPLRARGGARQGAAGRRAARRAPPLPSALPAGLPDGRRTTPLVGRRRRGPRLLAPRRHAPVPRRRAGVGRRNDVEARLRRRRRVRRGVRARRRTRRRAGGVTRRDRLEGAPSVRAQRQRRVDLVGHGGPEPAARFLHRGRTRGLGGFRDVLVTSPSIRSWPSGGRRGTCSAGSTASSTSGATSSRQSSTSVPYPTDKRASRTDTARPSCARQSTRPREKGNASRSQVHAQRFERKQGATINHDEGKGMSENHQAPPEDLDPVQAALNRAVSRRTLLRGAALGGAALSTPALLAACGGDDGGSERRRPRRPGHRAPSATSRSTPSPTVSRGTSSGRSTGTASATGSGSTA